VLQTLLAEHGVHTYQPMRDRGRHQERNATGPLLRTTPARAWRRRAFWRCVSTAPAPAESDYARLAAALPRRHDALQGAPHPAADVVAASRPSS
jgi:hypothetical protein